MQYHNTLDALTYYQTGAECDALYLQSFACARMALELGLERRLHDGGKSEDFYLTTDCDETIFDNSAYNVWLARTGRDFHASTWSEWCQTRGARATAGALEFLHFADQHGVKIFYVSGRFEVDREATADNLRKLSFPLPDASTDLSKTHLFLENMLIDGAATRKAEQFALLEKRHGSPLLRLGDNLSDLVPGRYSKGTRFDQRAAFVREDAASFGTKWIVMPNPMYGNWRESLRLPVGEKEEPIRDEAPPAAYQAAPVRPPLTREETPKLAVLRTWSDRE